MFKKTRKAYYSCGAAIMVGLTTAAADANAAGNSFSVIAKNITTQVQDLPALLSAVAYLFGILLGVLGIMKIKDHVENPTQTPLKDGAIRLLAGGGLFALPIVFESMNNLLVDSSTTTGAKAATLKKVEFSVN